jgi:hypothetical protein
MMMNANEDVQTEITDIKNKCFRTMTSAEIDYRPYAKTIDTGFQNIENEASRNQKVMCATQIYRTYRSLPGCIFIRVILS